MTDPREALEAMGLSADRVIETDKALQQRGPRDGRICMCGHGVSKHNAESNVCQPSAMDCPCRVIRPVIEVEDTRVFLRKTAGGGEMHALARGLGALSALGKSFEWLIDLKCDRCGAVDEVVTPVPVTSTGFATTYPTGYDAFLCRPCREEI